MNIILAMASNAQKVSYCKTYHRLSGIPATDIHNTIGYGRSHIYSLGHAIKDTYCLENPHLFKNFLALFYATKTFFNPFH